MNNVNQLARKVWDYHHLNHTLVKADCIFVLGSHDTRVAEYAAWLYKEKYAPYILFSGGLGNFTEGVFTKPEADLFAEIAIHQGVPADAILIENKSTNTGENIRFTKKMLEEKGQIFNSFILVQKPYMERRTYATFMKQWPDKEFIVTSPKLSYEEYPTKEITKERMINIMVGDLQRIKEYPALGYQIAQDIPDDVWDAWKQLVELGYTEHLIKTNS